MYQIPDPSGTILILCLNINEAGTEGEFETNKETRKETNNACTADSFEI